MNENFKKSNQDLEVLKKLQKEKDIAEEKKIEEFSLKKDQMFNLRRKKEEEKAKEKQRQRQILIDKQVEYLKNLKNNEDQRIENQVKEANDKFNKAQEEKKQRIDKLMKQIEENIDSQQKRRKMISDQEKRNEKGFVELWKDKMNHLEEAEALEKKRY